MDDLLLSLYKKDLKYIRHAVDVAGLFEGVISERTQWTLNIVGIWYNQVKVFVNQKQEWVSE